MAISKGDYESRSIVIDIKRRVIAIDVTQVIREDDLDLSTVSYRIKRSGSDFVTILDRLLPKEINASKSPRNIFNNEILLIVQEEIQARKDAKLNPVAPKETPTDHGETSSAEVESGIVVEPIE